MTVGEIKEHLSLHEFHSALGANFATVNGLEVVSDYGDALGEHSALLDSAGVLDLSFRSRLCLVGADRVRFLHGQVTNDIKALRQGEGCYAALVTAKGRMQSDLNIYNLGEELLLDFEPGLSGMVSQRLEKYIVADDVQVVDAAPLCGLLSVQGPSAQQVIKALALFPDVRIKAFGISKVNDPNLGEMYLMNRPRAGANGFDLFVPNASLAAVADKMIAAAKVVGGRVCGWTALEMARIEAGVPRFGVDIDETNFPQETGIDARAVSYTKGCYIGQEVLNRIHTMGHVNRQLCRLRLAGQLQTLPAKGDKVFQGEREVGYVTSALASPALEANIALGYVRKEASQVGTQLLVRSAAGEAKAQLEQIQQPIPPFLHLEDFAQGQGKGF